MSAVYLAVDSATEACSVALWLDGAIRERFEAAGRDHARLLPGMVQALLAESGVRPAQLDGIACGVGPGSFAGVRVGVAFVKAMALALERPVLALSSLALLAQAAAGSGADGALAAIDARMHEVYFGEYEFVGGLARARRPDAVLAPAAVVAAGAGEFAAVGSGWGVYREILMERSGARLKSVDPQALPHARDALRLGVAELAAGGGITAAALQPLYLRDRVALTSAEQQAARAAQKAQPPAK